MDASCASSMRGGTPDSTPASTPVLPNDSGYITATPSPLCNESPYICNNAYEESSKYIGIYDTPFSNQKLNKLAGSRKFLLKESYAKTTLKSNEETNGDDSNTQYSVCLPLRKDCGSNLQLPPSELSNSLNKCFCHLKVVDETSCDVHNFKTTLCDVDNNFVNSKKKSTNWLTSAPSKKFKSDSDIHILQTNQTAKNTSRFCSFIGISHLDFFVHLSGLSGCFPGIVSLILSYLSAKDLVTVCMVSSEWRKICVADQIANSRRLIHVRHIKHSKENVSWNEFKQSCNSLNLSITSRKGIFREIQNTDKRNSTSSTPPTPRSPPVSPSKVRFTMFVKAGVALDEGKRLVPCPRCSHPSQASYGHASCQAVGCQYNFCLLCLCDSHEGLPCSSRSAMPARRRTSCVGSKESRRNLRRL